MGIQNGSKCTANLSNIPLVGLMKVLRHLRSSNTSDSHGNANHRSDARPCIDFDMNWLFMSKTKAGDSTKVKVDKVLAIINAFAKCGCVCQPVSDQELRHHTKRASIQRRADRVILEIKVKRARYELAQVNQELMSVHSAGVGDPDLEKKKTELAKVAKRELRDNEVSPDLVHMLKNNIDGECLFIENEAGGCVERVITGIYQADLLLAKRYMNKISTTIVSSDGDFAFLVGDRLVQIKDFHFDFKSKEITNISLSFTSNTIAKEFESMLKDGGINGLKHTVAQYEFFSTYSDLETRALIAFGLGSDVLKGGCKGVGPVNLNSFLVGLEGNTTEGVTHELKKWYSSKLKTTVQTIEAYQQAMIYEPTNDRAEMGIYEYLDHSPRILYSYTKDFLDRTNKESPYPHFVPKFNFKI